MQKLDTLFFAEESRNHIFYSFWKMYTLMVLIASRQLLKSTRVATQIVGTRPVFAQNSESFMSHLL